MGFRLREIVELYAPDSLTHREVLVLGVIASEANDRTRVCWTSLQSEVIQRRCRVSRSQMYEVIRSLLDKGALTRLQRGQKGRRAAYQIPVFAGEHADQTAQGPGCRDAERQGPEIRDAEHAQGPETPDTVDDAQGPGFRDANDRSGSRNPDFRVLDFGTPPVYPVSTPPLTPPQRPPLVAEHPGGGGRDSDLKNTPTRAPSMRSSPTVDPPEPESTTPTDTEPDREVVAAVVAAVPERYQRAVQVSVRRWWPDAHEALAAGLSAHDLAAVVGDGWPTECESPTGLMRSRLRNAAAAGPPPESQSLPWDGLAWCGKCDPDTRQVELDDGRVARCGVCHPLARRRARAAA